MHKPKRSARNVRAKNMTLRQIERMEDRILLSTVDLSFYSMWDSGQNQYTPGIPIAYTITVENQGNSTVPAGAQISDLLPAGMAFSKTVNTGLFSTSTGGASPTTGVGGGTYQSSGSSITWTLPAIAPGGMLSVSVVEKPTTASAPPTNVAGTVTNIATLTMPAGATNSSGSTTASVTDNYQAASAPSSTSLASLASTSYSGNVVTFTASVLSGTGNTAIPTGTLQFYNNGTTALGSAVSLSAAGTATYTDALVAGSSPYQITAVYSGDSNYAASTSPNITQTVELNVPTVSMVSATNPVTAGNSVSFTATVGAGTTGSVTPTGTVQFYNGSTPIGAPVTVSGSGTASYSTSALGVGSQSISASYSGDGNYTTGISSALVETVNLPVPTVTLYSSNSSAIAGSLVTFTATVAGSSGAPTPTGTVQFYEGSTPLGSAVALSGGIASYSTSSLAAGNQFITAVYSGSSSYATQKSSQLSQTITSTTVVASTIGIISLDNPSTLGTTVNITATVLPGTSGGSPITGSVQFYNNGIPLGSAVTLSAAGTATYSSTSLPSGSNSITASYQGNYAKSTTSPALTQTVNLNASTTTLLSSSSSSYAGTSVTFTATVAGSSTAPLTPTGTVQFYNGPTALGLPVEMASGIAQFTTSALVVGSQSITASYSGDSNYAASTSAVYTQTVNPLVNVGVSLSISATLGKTPYVVGSSTLYVPGNQLTYTFSVNNSGSASLAGTTLVNYTAPAGYAIVNAVAPNSSSYQVTNTSSIAFKLKNLPTGTSTMSVTIYAAAPIPMASYITSAGTLPPEQSGVNGVAAPVAAPTITLPAGYTNTTTGSNVAPSLTIPIAAYVVSMVDSVTLPVPTNQVYTAYAGNTSSTVGQFCVAYTVRQLVNYYNLYIYTKVNTAQPLLGAFNINLGGGTYTFVNSPYTTSNDYAYQLSVNDAGQLGTGRVPLVISNGTINANFVSRAFSVSGGQSLYLENVLVENGYEHGGTTNFSPAGPDALGGGVYVNAGSVLVLKNSRIQNCVASGLKGTQVTTRARTAAVASGRHGVGYNAAGGGIYGAAGSNITIDGNSAISGCRVIGGKGGNVNNALLTMGGTGGGAYGGAIAIGAPQSGSVQTAPTKVSILTLDGGASISGNMLNRAPNAAGTKTVTLGGTGGTISNGVGTGGAGGNAFGAGLYMYSGELVFNSGNKARSVTVVGNVQSPGKGYSNGTVTPGPVGTSGGVLYLTPGQVSVSNPPAGAGMFNFSASAITVANSGFETPTLAAGVFVQPPTGSGLGWSFSGSAGISSNGSGFTGANATAPQGNQVALIQAAGTISQSLTGFRPGLAYVVHFDAATRVGSSGGPSTFTVSINGTVLGTYKPTTSYQAFTTLSFVPTSNSATLTFTNLDPSNLDQTTFLDQVSVAPQLNQSIVNGASTTANLDLPVPLTTVADAAVSSVGLWNLRTAVTAASSLAYSGMATTLELSAGTYTLTQGSLLVTSVETGSLTIQGVGAGTSPSVSTMISGNNSSTVGSIFKVSNSILSLSKLTLEHGNATTGGAIDATNTNAAQAVALASVSVLSNTASGNGGGVYQSGGSLKLTNTNIEQNAAGGSGGAIMPVYGCAVTITGGQLSNNTAGVYGGAIFSNESGYSTGTISLSGVTLTGNKSASNVGGAICVSAVTLTLTNDIFTSNTTSLSLGGALYANVGSTVTVTGTSFTKNSAYMGGAIAANSGAQLKLNTVNVSSNTATSGSGGNGGGGIYQSSGSLALSNTNIRRNKAIWGGGIYLNGTTFSMLNGTINNNIATSLGGGVYVSNSPKVPMTLSSVTVSSNKASGAGGGIQGTNVPLTLSGCTFTGNSSLGNGGAVFVNGTSLLIVSGGSFAPTGNGVANTAVNGGAIAATEWNGGKPVVTVSNATITGNTVSGSGGGLYASNSSLSLKGDHFKLNKAGYAGGGLAAVSATVKMTGGYAKSNSVTGGSALWSSSNGGGGLYVYKGSLGLKNVSIKKNHNSAGAPGAGVALASIPAAKMTTVSISSNTISTPGAGYGGGLFLSGGTLNAKALNVKSNAATTTGATGQVQGGGIFDGAATMNFSGSLNISGNTLSGPSGGNASGAGVRVNTAGVMNAPGGSWSVTSNTITGVMNGVGAGLSFWNGSNLTGGMPTLSGNSAPAGGNNLAWGVFSTSDDGGTTAGLANFSTSGGSLRSALNWAQGLADDGWASVGVILGSNSTYSLNSPLYMLTAGEVTVSGQGGGTPTISSHGNGRNMTIGNATWHGSFILNSVNITGGNVTAGTGGTAVGGGIYHGGGTLKINNSNVQNNQAVGGTGSSPTHDASWNSNGEILAGDHIKGAGAGGNAYGGGIYQAAGSLYLLNSNIRSNSAIGGVGGYGTEGNGINGANGLPGGSAFGGGMFVNSGSNLYISPGSGFESNKANGGKGGQGGYSTNKTSGTGGTGGDANGGGLEYDGYVYYDPLSNLPQRFSGNSQTAGSGGAAGGGHGGGKAGGSGTNWGSSSCNNYSSAGHAESSSGSNVSPLAVTGMYQSTGSLAVPPIRVISGGVTPSAVTRNHGTPMVGLVLELHSADGSLIAKTASDSTGQFHFQTKYTGMGYLQVKLPPTHKLAPRGTMTNAGILSTFDATTGKSDEMQFVSGQLFNQQVHLVLHKYESALITGPNFVQLSNKETGKDCWRRQLAPGSYTGGFTVSQIDVNGDRSPDYVVIPKTGPATPFLIDGRTGVVQKIKGYVSNNLRKGFTAQAQNLVGSDGLPDLVLIPNYGASGQITVINTQTLRVSWSSQRYVSGGMNVNYISANDTRDLNLAITSNTYNNLHHGYAQILIGGHSGKVLLSGFIATPTSPPISPPSHVVHPKALKHAVGQAVPRVSGFTVRRPATR